MIQALARVIDNSRATGIPYVVLLMIANHEGDHNGDQYSWPSADTLAREARCSTRHVRRAIQTLEELGELAVERGAGPKGTNLYRVTVSDRWGTDTVSPLTSDVPDVTRTVKNLDQELKTFDHFWNPYPRKIGKGAARKAFVSAQKRASTEDIIEGVTAFAASVKGTEARFIPHPATWLNADRWDDEEPTVTVPEPEFYQPAEPDEGEFKAFLEAVAANPYKPGRVGA